MIKLKYDYYYQMTYKQYKSNLFIHLLYGKSSNHCGCLIYVASIILS